MGRGPARPIKNSEDWPRPDPAHHIFKFSRPGPARPIKFSKVSIRPDPTITFSKVSARPGTTRHNFLINQARPGREKRPIHDKPCKIAAMDSPETRTMAQTTGTDLRKSRLFFREESRLCRGWPKAERGPGLVLRIYHTFSVLFVTTD